MVVLKGASDAYDACDTLNNPVRAQVYIKDHRTHRTHRTHLEFIKTLERVSSDPRPTLGSKREQKHNKNTDCSVSSVCHHRYLIEGSPKGHRTVRGGSGGFIVFVSGGGRYNAESAYQ